MENVSGKGKNKMLLKERENCRLKGFFKVLEIFNSLMLFSDSALDNALGVRLRKKETNPSLQTAMLLTSVWLLFFSLLHIHAHKAIKSKEPATIILFPFACRSYISKPEWSPNCQLFVTTSPLTHLLPVSLHTALLCSFNLLQTQSYFISPTFLQKPLEKRG